MKFDQITKMIENNNKFLITGHETPDADSFGAAIGLHLVLSEMGKDSIVIASESIQTRLSFIYDTAEITIFQNDIFTDLDERILIILDTNETNIGIKKEDLLDLVKEWFIIDHHDYKNNLIGKNFIMNEASSTCEILYEFFAETKKPISLQIARALFTGIVYDTGSFIYPKTSSKTFKIAGKLVELGVNPSEIHSYLYESNSSSSLLLQKEVLNSLELYYQNRLSIMSFDKNILLKTKAYYEDAQQLINIPLQSKDIQVSVLFKENKQGVLRCSLRSKGDIDISTIARKEGGGGHKTAAGFICLEPIEIIKLKVLDMLKVYF